MIDLFATVRLKPFLFAIPPLAEASGNLKEKQKAIPKRIKPETIYGDNFTSKFRKC